MQTVIIMLMLPPPLSFSVFNLVECGAVRSVVITADYMGVFLFSAEH